MPYEAEKDKVLKEIILENAPIHVRLVQYADGPKKIAVLNQYSEGMFTTKISRMTKNVALALANAINELAADLDE